MKIFTTLLCILLTFFWIQNSAQISFSINSPTLCSGSGANTNIAVVTVTTVGTTNYTWATVSSTCNASYTLTAGNGSSCVLSYSCPGSYSVYCYAMNGASTLAVAMQTVVIYPTLSITASVVPNNSVGCLGNTYSLFASGALTYTWAGAVISNGTFAPLSSGCLTVAGTNALGCTAYTVACFTVNPLPNISVTGPTSVCAGAAGTLVAAGASNYTWTPTFINGPVAVVAPTVSTCYTVYGSNAFGCTGSATLCVFLNPTPTLVVNGNTISCSGIPNILSANGANSYIWSIGSTTSSITVSPLVNTCYSVIGTSASGCTNFAVHCISVQANPSISIAGNNTFCLGSSVNYTASGANSYTWNTSPAVNTSTLSMIPTTSFTYMAYGTGSNGCVGFASLSNSVNSNCAIVWPGDANRDGVVSNTDVLELGLAANNTGPARTPTSNAWTGQYATAWTGTVSTGWNKAHADCNGDGIVNAADNTAITQNFALTHGFKNTSNNSVNPDISLVPAQALVYAGNWNRADIMLGDASNTMTQLYGVAFDVDFDQSLVQSDSVRVDYTPSFLNAANQHIDFGKSIFANSKTYAASVRIDHNNVSGHGKIGEFWYKLNNVIPANSIMNLSVSNAVKVSASGNLNNLTSGSTSVTVSNSPVGMRDNLLTEQAISIYPNPASHFVTLQNRGTEPVDYIVMDVLGREVLNGKFNGTKKVDISMLQQGAYLIQFECAGMSVHKKLVIEKR